MENRMMSTIKNLGAHLFWGIVIILGDFFYIWLLHKWRVIFPFQTDPAQDGMNRAYEWTGVESNSF